MATFLYKTKDGGDPKGKPRVYFTCHPEDFTRYFEKICEDIFKTHDCAVYYTQDMTEAIEEENLAVDLGQMNLFVVPVTVTLLTQSSRAMDVDLAYAMQMHIPILPFLMDRGIDELYSRSEVFGQRQYLVPDSTDPTEIRYEDKLKKHLESVLISDEMAKRVRSAFDAYIFLSYRKKDRRYANELMKLIHKNPGCWDIAIWYDEFLTPGERFTDNIRNAMGKSKLFTLLVTPNLLEEPDGKPNFVMGVEYPEAKKAKKTVLPAEMEPTDHNALAEKYRDLPSCLDPRVEPAFFERLLQATQRIAVPEKDGKPEHNYLIGLAYLDGIDVEVDRLRGFELLSSAAQAGLPEAMKRLMEMYRHGEIVPKSVGKAIEWGEKLLACYTQLYGEDHPEAIQTLIALGDMEFSTTGYTPDKDKPVYGKVLGYYDKAWTLHTGKHGEVNEIASDILRKIGRVYGRLDKKRTVEVKEKIYKVEKALFGQQHTYTITALANWAIACMESKNYDQARELLHQALPMAQTQFGKNHALTLSVARCLAEAYMEVGHLQHALDILTREYKEEEYTEKGDPEAVTHILNTIAYIFKKAERHQEERIYREKAYWHQQRIPGGKKWDFLATDRLIRDFKEHGDHAGLLAFLQKVYEGQRQDLGEEHNDVLDTLEEIAGAYQKQGNYAKALETLRKLYSIQYRVFLKKPAKDMWTQLTLDGTLEEMCKNYALQGETAEAAFFKSKANINRYLDVLDSQPGRLIRFGEIGAVYDRCGDENLALQMAEKTYEEKVRVLGQAHRDTLMFLHSLAECFFRVQNHGKALEYLTTILTLQRHYLEADHPYLLGNLKVLVDLCEKMQLQDKAEEARKYICDHEAKEAADLPETAQELQDLLRTLGANSDERVLEIREKLYQLACRETGELSSAALERLDNLAYAYERCGNYGRAVELLEKLHKLATTIMGDSYLITMSCNANSVWESLSRCYLLSGDMPKAIEAAEARYQLNYDNNGPESRNTQAALRSMALTYQKAGQLDKAAQALEKAYAAKVAKDGDGFISTGPNGTRWADDVLLEDLVSVYTKLGGNARAVRLGEKLCEVRIEIYGREHSKTLTAMTWLGYLYSQVGQDQKALEIMQQIYDLRVKVSGEEAPATLTVLNNLAVLYGNVGEHRKALTLQQKVYESRRKAQGESHPQTLQALRNLVYAYAWVEAYKTALEYAEVSCVLHCQVYGPDDVNTLAARETLEDMNKKVHRGS